MRKDVEFAGYGGVTLRGWLYLPDAGPQVMAEGAAEGAPAIVMAHGFSATRHMGLAEYAEVFCAAGFAVLVYDHRGLGDSDGAPRREINPWAQARDYRYALTWLEAQPGIDPDRLGLWGSSFSGGEVLVVGAVDPRVKAVVASVPFAGMSTEPDLTDLDQRFAVMRAAIEDDTGTGPADCAEPVIGPMPVVRASGGDPDGPAFLPQPEATAWFESLGGAGSGWANSFTLRGLGGEPRFDPAVAAPFIAPRPLLMVVADQDRVAPVEVARATFAIAGEPKQLVEITGDHFTPYAGEGFARSSAAMRDFLLAHL